MADTTQRQQLDLDAAAAIAELKRLKAALLDANKTILNSGQAFGAFNAQGAAFTQGAKAASAGAQQMATGLGSVNPQLAANTAAIQVINQNLRQLGPQAQQATRLFTLSWQSVERIVVAGIIRRGIFDVISALGAAEVESRKFELSIAEVQGIGRDLQVSNRQLADSLFQVSNAFGSSIDNNVEAFYQALSNQISSSAAVLQEFVIQANEFGVATRTGPVESVQVLTSALKGFQLSTVETRTVADQLFKAVELGRFRIDEIANSFGRVSVLGNTLGVSLSETLAALATLTVGGVKADEAMTLLNNVYSKLLKPSEALSQRFSELGFTSGAAAVAALGFNGTLEKLAESTHGSRGEMGELFNQIRSLRGALALGGKDSELFRQNLEKIRASNGAVQQAKELVFKTNAKVIEQELNSLRNTALQVGEGFNAVLAASIRATGGLTTLGEATAIVLAGVVGGLAVTNAGLITATLSAEAFTAVLAANPLVLPFVALGLAIGGVTAALNRAKQASDDAKNKFISDAEETARTRIQKDREATDAIIASITQRTAGLLKEEQVVQRAAAILQASVFGALNAQIQNRVAAFGSFVSGVTNIITNARQKIAELTNDVKAGQDRLDQFLFERQNKRFEVPTQVFRDLERSNNLDREALQLAQSKEETDRKRADELANQAVQQAQVALQLADQTGDAGLIHRAEQGVADALASQKALREEALRLEKERVAVAEKNEARLIKDQENLKAIAAKLSELKVIQETGGKVSFVNDFLTPEDVKTKTREVATELESALRAAGKNVSLADTLNLRKELDEALRPIATFGGVPLKLAFDAPIQSVFDKMQEVFKKQPIQVQLEVAKFTGKEINTISQVQDALVGAKDRQQELSKSFGDTAQVAANANAQLIQNVAQVIDKINQLKGETEGNNPIGALAIEGAKAIQTFNEEALARTIVRLQNIREEAAKVPASINIATGQITGNTATVSLIQEVIDRLIQARQDFNKTGEAAVNNQAAEQALDVERQRVDDLARAYGELQRAKAEAAATSGSAPIGQQTGGLMIPRFALGGFSSKGTDSILAALSPGEAVINARSARDFATQIAAINAGMRPVFRESGGTVNNVGDVHLNVTQSAPPAALREIADGLRRAIRKGTIKLS